VILSSVGILLGLLLAFYGLSLVDASPTQIRERPNLVVGLTFLGPWLAAWAFRLRVARPAGVGGGLLLAAGIALVIVGPDAIRTADAADPLQVAVVAAGLALVGVWAMSATRALQDGRAIGRVGPAIPVPPVPLSWRWVEPLPGSVGLLVRVAGLAALADGVARLAL
jgi:hypothetical protein